MKLEDLEARAVEQRRGGHLRVPEHLLGLAPRAETVLIAANHGTAVGAKSTPDLANRAQRRAMAAAARRRQRGQARAAREVPATSTS